MRRAYTETDKSRQHYLQGLTPLKSHSKQLIEKLRKLYKHSYCDQPAGLRIKKSSPGKIDSKLKLNIPAKSRTPKQKCSASPPSGYLSNRNKQQHGTNLHSARQYFPPPMQDLKKKMEIKGFSKLNGTQKYFKKQKEKIKIDSTLDSTLRMVWNFKAKKAKNQFRVIKQLGKSQIGQILLSLSNATGMILALKTFRKEQVKIDFLIDQTKIHLYCSHPHILPAYSIHFGKDLAFLIMEVGECNLYDKIIKNGPFDQHKTALFISQIASAVEYLHSLGVMHRDIKPENIICFGDSLKIADFGWSIKAAQPRKTLCGTLDYISPEVANRQHYSNKIDVWSIGVLMYEMLTGQAPFPQQQINIQFQGLRIPKYLSDLGKDLLQKILEFDPIDRLTAKQVREHQWIKFHLKKQKHDEKRKYKLLKVQLQSLFQ